MFVQAAQDHEQFQHGYGGPHARLDFSPPQGPSISVAAIVGARTAIQANAAGRHAQLPPPRAQAPAGRLRAEAEMSEEELALKYPKLVASLKKRYADEATKGESEKKDEVADEDLTAEQFEAKFPKAAKRIRERALVEESAKLAKKQAAEEAEAAKPEVQDAKAAARFSDAWTAKAKANAAAKVPSPQSAALMAVARVDPEGHRAWILVQQGRAGQR